MIVSALQMPVAIGDRLANIAALRRLAAAAMRQKSRPDLLVLPELWDIGFFPRPLADHADIDGELPRRVLAEIAKEYAVNIVGGSIACRQNDGKIKNSCFVYDRQGRETARFDKVHLFSPGHEDRHFAPGDECAAFTVDGVTCGAVICYDLRFGELFRRLALQGAQIVFVPTQWPQARREHWELLTRCRAIDNEYFIVGCNAKGAFSSGLPLCGYSCVVDPWGDVLAVRRDDEEAIVTAEINLARLTEIRDQLPLLADRRPEVY